MKHLTYKKTEGIGMDKKKKEMLVDILGAIGWQGFDLAIYEDGSWDYENKNRYESNPTARYIDLEDYEYWDSYLGDFKNTGGDDDDYEDEDYEDVYEVADDAKKKAMIDALAQAIGDNIVGQDEYAPYDDDL